MSTKTMTGAAAAAALWAVLAAPGCGGHTKPATTEPETTPAAGGEPATFDAQVAAGAKLYAVNCASCHGAGGEGGKGPRVVGLDQGALPLDPPAERQFRKEQFKTAADVAGFVVKNMPPGKGGSLEESEYWSILAFDLHANGVDLPQKIDGTNAATVVIHK